MSWQKESLWSAEVMVFVFSVMTQVLDSGDKFYWNKGSSRKTPTCVQLGCDTPPILCIFQYVGSIQTWVYAVGCFNDKWNVHNGHATLQKYLLHEGQELRFYFIDISALIRILKMWAT